MEAPQTVKTIKLLGSNLFGDLQARGSSSGQGKATNRTQVQDVHMAKGKNEDQDAYYAAGGAEEPSDEDILCYFLEQNDIDALYVSEFKHGIVEAVQDSSLAPAHPSYQEARLRLRDKAKSPGFFPCERKSEDQSRKGKGAGNSREG